MKEWDITVIWFGDLDIFEECAKRLNKNYNHPISGINSMLNALDNSKLFTKGNMKTSNKNYRTFTIKKLGGICMQIATYQVYFFSTDKNLQVVSYTVTEKNKTFKTLYEPFRSFKKAEENKIRLLHSPDRFQVFTTDKKIVKELSTEILKKNIERINKQINKLTEEKTNNIHNVLDFICKPL